MRDEKRSERERRKRMTTKNPGDRSKEEREGRRSDKGKNGKGRK